MRTIQWAYRKNSGSFEILNSIAFRTYAVVSGGMNGLVTGIKNVKLVHAKKFQKERKVGTFSVQKLFTGKPFSQYGVYIFVPYD